MITQEKIALSRTQFWWKRNDQYCWSCLHELRFDVYITTRSRVRVFGALNLKHRGQHSGPVGYGVKASLRSAPSFADLPVPPQSSIDLPYWQSVENTHIIPGSKRAGNIASIAHHYGPVEISYALTLEPGAHRIEHWGCSHTMGYPENESAYVELNQNAYPDPKDPYTMLFMEVETA